MILKTQRLLLRPWQDSDRISFQKINSDPRVREFFPSLLTAEESDQQAKVMALFIEQNGWGLWAAEIPGVAPFIGFIGLMPVSFSAHFTPAIEIGWRLAYEHWGHGYAPEGAKAALDFGFQELKLPEIVSFTSSQNTRSRRVMEKIGMHRDPADDFDHPKLPEGHPLRKHVLYRLKVGEMNPALKDGE
ncbi:MAG: GNAT family N-acetyltransferase [Verrucomicrobiota bacterium]|nr:GNAT family N-acetyltransferase [Verrucomicrobiota bacterium]